MINKLKNSEFIFDSKAIKYLADLLNNSTLTEVEYKCGEISIKFSKQHIQQPMQIAPQIQQTCTIPNTMMPINQTANNQTSEEKIIKAPVVGKIYVASKPGEAPFIKVGDTIKEGQIIFIIEAMKVMNNVKANKSGVVKEILIQDNMPVEYGQKLLTLE